MFVIPQKTFYTHPFENMQKNDLQQNKSSAASENPLFVL